MNEITCAIYSRVSTLDKQSARSCGDQVRDARRFCADQGWKVVAEFQDDGVTGSDDERPGLNVMLRDAAAGKFQAIVCESTDRISRNEWLLPRIAADLAFRDQFIVTVDGRFDSRQESSSLLAAVEGFIGGAEKKKMKQRIRRGLRGNAEIGLETGGSSFGYRSVALDPSDPRFDHRNPKRRQSLRVIDPDTAEWVKRIFEWRLAGESCKAIAARLTQAGVPSPGACWRRKVPKAHWAGSSVRVILSNPCYCGRVVYNTTERRQVPGTRRRISRPRPRSEWLVREDATLRIVDPAIWENANSLFSRQPTMSESARAGRGPKFPLSGLLRCGYCDGNLVIGSHDTYRCGRHNENRAACNNRVRIGRRPLEATVMSMLEAEVLNDGAIEHVARRARELAEQRLREDASPIRKSAEVARLDHEIEELRGMMKSGKVRPELLEPALRGATERRAALLANGTRRGDGQPERLAVAVTQAGERIRRQLRKLAHTNDPGHAAVVRATLAKFLQGGTIKVTPRDDGKAIGELVFDKAAYVLDLPNGNNLVPVDGFEPPTSRLRSDCSTN